MKHTLLNHSDNLQILRMVEDLSEFSFVVRRVQGISNGVADWLSRIPLANTPWRNFRLPETKVPQLQPPEAEMHGLDFDGIDPLALIGAEDDPGLVNSSVLEPICPSCRCSISSFLSRMMETQYRPVLDDWPIHQRLFESMHK